MSGLIHRIFAVAAIPALFLSGQSALAVIVTNGDFEDTTGWGSSGTSNFPAGWSQLFGSSNPVDQQNGGNQIAGTTSAYFPASDKIMHQPIAGSTGASWTFAIDFAATDPGDGSARTVDIALSFNSGAGLYIRVNGDGDVQFHNGANGGGWTTPSGLAGAVSFDADVTTTPLVNQLVIEVNLNSDSSLSSYDATLGAFSATNVNYFITSLPNDTHDMNDISFFASATGGWVADNISLTTVPEPASGALALLGLGVFLRGGRRKR